MLKFTRDGASGGPKAIVWAENDKNRLLTEINGFCSLELQTFATSYIKPCTFLWRTQTANKVESILHTIALADAS